MDSDGGQREIVVLLQKNFFLTNIIKNRINFIPTYNIYILERKIERKSLQNFLLEMKL